MSELRSLLEAGLVEERFLDRLTRYGELVLETNRQFNLTGAKNAAEFAPHILDSVHVARLVEGTLVDIGSGGGLPAIPIAIVTGVSVTMIETTLKKARFLERMLDEFSLPGEVVAQRAEVAAHDPRLREHFHTGTARAVSSAPTVAELLLPFIAVGGAAVLQRGVIDPREHQALQDAALILGAETENVLVEMTELGADDPGRHVIIVRKKSPTPQKYPRRVGVPEKKPLCF